MFQEGVGAIIMVFVGLLVLCGLFGMISGITVSSWVSERLSGLFLGLSSERFQKPQPLIGQAAAKAVRGDIQGAKADYERMLREHPGNAELYLRLMELSYGPLQRPEYGDRVLQHALRNIQSEHERKAVRRLGAALKNGEVINHQHLGFMKNLERGIQPPLLHLGDAALSEPQEKTHPNPSLQKETKDQLSLRSLKP